MTVINISTLSGKPDVEFLDTYTFLSSSGEVDYELELTRVTEGDTEQLWVTLYTDGDYDQQASLTGANEFDEIGDFWLGQFPRASDQVGKWAREYL